VSRLLFPFSLDVPFVLYRPFFCIAGVLCVGRFCVFGLYFFFFFFFFFFVLAFGRLFGFLGLGLLSLTMIEPT
jgi:hypothetical protein